MKQERRNDLIGAGLLLITAMIWGCAFSMQEMAAELPPFTLILYRSAVAVLFLIPVILLFDFLNRNNAKRSLFRKNEHPALDISFAEWRGGFLSGIALLIATALQQIGIGETGAGKTGFITSLYMVMVPLLGLLFGKRIGKQNACAVAIAVFGFYFISMKGFEPPAVSDLIVLSCAFVFAVQILVIAAFSKGCDGVRFSFVQFLTCAVLSLPISLLFEKPAFEAGGTSLLFTALSLWLPILYLGILSSGVAYTFQILGQQKMQSQTVASILMSLENIFAALFAAFFFPDRRLSPREIFGCAVVFFAVILTQLPLGSILKRKKRSTPDELPPASSADKK